MEIEHTIFIPQPTVIIASHTSGRACSESEDPEYFNCIPTQFNCIRGDLTQFQTVLSVLEVLASSHYY